MTVATGPSRLVGDPAACTPNNKTGNWFTGAVHSLNAIVGAGVLSLPWAVAQLGWVAGPALLLAFFLITRWASILLAELYCVDGLEHARYHHAVQHILGRRGAVIAGVFQTVNLVLLCLAYCIIGAESMRYIAVQLGSGFHRQYQMAMLFGVVQVALSQAPNLEKVWWVSLLGSAMSICYCTVALVLGAVYAGAGQGSVRGVTGLSTTEKAFNCLNALGSIGFAYSVSNVLIEITDTMRQPPSAVAQMRRAVNVALSVAAAFYCGVGILGYASLGDATPSLVLSGFTDAPKWALLVAHFAIVVGMMSAWQLFAQPVYELLESQIKAWRIRRQQRRQLGRRRVCPQAAPTAAAGCGGECGGECGGGAGPAPEESRTRPALPGVAASEEAAAAAAAAADALLEPAERLPSRCRLCGQALVYNSAPVPDLLPGPEGWARQDSFMRQAFEVEVHAEAGSSAAAAADAKPAHGGALSAVRSALECSHSSMYHACPGLANERVPLNDAGYLLPLPQRLAVRTTFVLAITLLAVVAPFVMSVIGLVGSVGWFPLTIAFPVLCWIKVYKPTGLRLAAMRGVCLLMLLVAAGATVGAVYTMVHSFQTVEFFQ